MEGRRALRWISVLPAVALLSLVLAPVPAEADAGAEADFVSRTNALRAGDGLPPLEVHPGLVSKARGWAQTMAEAGDIFHSELPDNAPEEWQRLGENVGTGPDVGSIHQALVASPSHYRNLMDPGFRFVGVGVVNANGTIFVSEVFMETASQPAPSTSASAAGTPSSSPERALAAAPAVPPPPPPVEPPPRIVAALVRLRALEG